MMRENSSLKQWMRGSRWASPFRWLYAISQIVNIKRQLQELEQKTDILLKAADVPFGIEVEFHPLLPRAESRIGMSASKLTTAERDVKFYSYFSELGGEYAQAVLRQQYDLYLKYLPRNFSHKFLDIGCGSGEFLSFLDSQGIPAVGIDLEKSEIERAKLLGLDAIQADADTFFKEHKEVFYSGISMMQVIEHIPSDRIINLLMAAVEQLAPGGVLLIETLNIRHPHSFNNFYIDPTHIRPIPHDYLGFLMEWVGLQDIRLLYSLPAWMPGVNNQDVSQIYMNYTLIGKKPLCRVIAKR